MTAFLGAIITADITLLLLSSQSSAREIKERNVKVFKKKSKLYEKYIAKLNQIIEKQPIKINDFKDIESEFYSKIVLYLKKKFREKITCCFEDIAYCAETSVIEESLNDHFETDNTKTKNFDRLRRNLSKIKNILAEDLGLAGKIDMDLLMKTEEKIFSELFRATLLQEVIDCFSKEKELFIKGVFYAKEEDDDPYIILDLQGENSLAGEIYIGPFVNRDKERLKFKVKAPQINRVADWYVLKYGNDKEKCFISLENKEAQDEYDEKGYIDLSLPLDDDTFKDSELDRDMYNKFIPSFCIEDSGSLYSRYHGIYLDVCKAIAKRAYHYFRKTYAISQKGEPKVLKDLCLEMGRVTESETNEYIMRKQGI